ncbi:MAG: hypothetical protein IJE68_05215 [Clostridia bacterium]|nr:hypothetical protein [Clostridia bacterium]
MKNKTRKIIGITCAILLIVLVQAIGVTYAKYLTEEKGTGSAEVAKWSFQIDKNGAQTKTVKLVDPVNKDYLINGKIAPGTDGTIVITLDGTGSEVDIDYSVKFANEKNKPTNLTFTCNGTSYKSLSEINNLIGTIKYDAETPKKDIIIFWRWNYETGNTPDEIATNDAIDTLDVNNITQYTFDIIATGTQSR